MELIVPMRKPAVIKITIIIAIAAESMLWKISEAFSIFLEKL